MLYIIPTLCLLSLKAYKKLMMYKKPSYVAEFGIGNEVLSYYLLGRGAYTITYIRLCVYV